MCARPRRVSDEEIFAAAARAMSRLHPRDLTLAAIGAEAGVTAGALVQRFGSKRELMLALARGAVDACPPAAEELIERHGSPLAALDAYVESFAGLAASPEAYRRNLAYLLEDLTDPELKVLVARQAEGNRAALRRLLAAARDSGELRADAEPEPLARLVEAMIGGGMTSWAFSEEGSAAEWLRALLADLLAPYRRRG